MYVTSRKGALITGYPVQYQLLTFNPRMTRCCCGVIYGSVYHVLLQFMQGLLSVMLSTSIWWWGGVGVQGVDQTADNTHSRL